MMSSKERTQRLVADPAGIEDAARVLAAGGLVALPTETVYGLAARADDNNAVAAIYAAKGRPSFNPLIVHVASLKAAQSLAMFDATALELARWAWPGPLTLVLPRSPDARLAEAVTAGLPTVAVRMPSHPVMRAVLEACGLPLAAPSANRSGAVSPTSAQHVLRSLKGRIDLVLDAGASPCGLESTIVAVRADGSLNELRPGPLDLAHFTAKLRGATSSNGSGGIEAPGQLTRHYAPGKPLRLDATQPDDDEYFIGFASASRADCNLSPSGDLTEAAAQLYACLHLAAASAKPRIAVAPVPMEGVGRAINDRLRRAAA
jgi:L-threonylcarbamoyladenylate synthase